MNSIRWNNKNISTVLAAIITVWASAAAGARRSSAVDDGEMIKRYEQWMEQYGRAYSNETEKTQRFSVFRDNAIFIDSFNRAGNHSYTLAINEFADLTNDEFRSSRMGYVPPPPPVAGNATAMPFIYENVTDPPPAVDWIKHGAVTPIKNQEQCVIRMEYVLNDMWLVQPDCLKGVAGVFGSGQDERFYRGRNMLSELALTESNLFEKYAGCCWAFSTVAATEGITKLTTGKLISLSEQQLVDCDRISHGCDGGWMEAGFKYITENRGITTEANYPYTKMQGPCQQSKASAAAARLGGFQIVPKNSEAELLKAVSRQPVSVSIDAAGQPMQFYAGGVFAAQCSTLINHAVTAVGYGTDPSGMKYWLLKNSWGPTWGERGFLRLLRDSGVPEGQCGVATQSSFPLPPPK
ncbi:unnamed protein product [Cuscuta campestris]|uniref:Cathepsin propeptide inhibitor domain-containing protein n=1 Tax=Cuscuta campestris TaxID=132261 RepID=A0A484LIF4_9ASTE|nr:unnamed protein product [Cuscuta campestris]